MTPAEVKYWFDPICPWSWVTSRWLVRAQQQRPIYIDWHLRSLSILNSDNTELPEAQRHRLEAGWGPIRVCMAVRKQYDSDSLGRFYTALGTRLYSGNQPITTDTVRDALADVDLPVGLTDAMSDGSFDDALRDDHDAAAAAVGREVGTPVTSIEGTAFFGPVLSPAPCGEAAARLWDTLHTLATIDGVYELVRGHPRQPSLV